jgi:hypothetical protein
MAIKCFYLLLQSGGKIKLAGGGSLRLHVECIGVGGDARGKRPALVWEKQILDLPEREKRPNLTLILRQEQNTRIAMDEELKRLRENELANARMTVGDRQATERDEFLKKQKRKEVALKNLVHTKTDKTQLEPMQVQSNRLEMRKQMMQRRDERIGREKSNREILQSGKREATRRVSNETQQFVQRQERIKQPLTALELANKARKKNLQKARRKPKRQRKKK